MSLLQRAMNGGPDPEPPGGRELEDDEILNYGDSLAFRKEVTSDGAKELGSHHDAPRSFRRL